MQRGTAEVNKGYAGAEFGSQGQLQLLVRANDEDSPAGRTEQLSFKMLTWLGSADWPAVSRDPSVSESRLHSKCRCCTLGIKTKNRPALQMWSQYTAKCKLQRCCCRPCLMVRGRSLLSLLLGSSIPYFVEISLSSSPRMGNLTSSYRQHGHTVMVSAGDIRDEAGLSGSTQRSDLLCTLRKSQS